MSTDRLQDLLAREAEEAPHVIIPADTWRRGRRRRTIKLLSASLAVAAVLVAVTVAPALLNRKSGLDPAGSSDDLGLPDHLFAPPPRMSEQDEFGSWARDEVSADLAVGRAAAAWVTPGGLLVVVDAETGEHRLLDLPDSAAQLDVVRSYVSADWQPVALSPDGKQLAYGTVESVRMARTGISVIDLETGQQAWSAPLSGDGGIIVTSLSWSRSGTWLGWQGSQVREWTEEAIAVAMPVAGVVGAEGSGPVVGVAGGGAVVTEDRPAAYVIEPGWIRGLRYCGPEGGGAVCVGPSWRWSAKQPIGLSPFAALSPDFSTLALSTDSGYDLITLPFLSRLNDVATPAMRFEPTVGAEGSPDDRPWSTTTLGWVDERNVLVLRNPNDGTPATLAIVPADPDTGVPSVDVGVVDSDVGVPSIAIDLVSYDQPTLDRPDPDWPWTPTRWVLTLGGTTAVIVVILLGAATWRRRRV